MANLLTSPIGPMQPKTSRETHLISDSQIISSAPTGPNPSGTMTTAPTGTRMEPQRPFGSTAAMPQGAPTSHPMGSTMLSPAGVTMLSPTGHLTAMPTGATTHVMPMATTMTMPLSSPLAMMPPAKSTGSLCPLPPRRDHISVYLTYDEHHLAREVDETHTRDGNRSIDVKPLYQLVTDVLTRATHVDSQMLSSGSQMITETMEGKGSFGALANSTDLPIIIDRLSCEMLCKSTVCGNAHEATIALLKLLTEFPWDAKVVLTEAAFAMTYGEFLLLAQIYPSNPLARSMAVLKQLPMLVEQSGFFKNQLDAINKLITAILRVTGCIIQFHELQFVYLTEEEPKLKAAWSYFPIAVYWTMRSAVSAAAHITTLTSRRFEYLPSANIVGELSTLEHRLNSISDHMEGLRKDLVDLIGRKRDDEEYIMLRRLIYETHHINNMPVLSRLLRIRDDPIPLYDCSTRKRVHLEALKEKNVLLFISDLTISQDELYVLELIYNETKVHEYEMVWLPIVDRLLSETDTMDKIERHWSSMKWYSVHHPYGIDNTVVKFVHLEWNFRSKPILVVIDPRGKVINENAIHMMFIWGSGAFPFDRLTEKRLWAAETLRLELFVDAIDQTVWDWMREGSYIFMIGGDDLKWISSFIRQARSVGDSAGISIKMLYVGKSHTKRDTIARVSAALKAEELAHCLMDHNVWFFWQRIESMLLSKVQLEEADNPDDIIVQEIKKLLSYDKCQGGWALLSKGSSIILNGHGSSVLLALEQYQMWKEEAAANGFEQAFKNHIGRFDLRQAPCCRFEFDNGKGRLPSDMKCPECRHLMSKYTTFICCHDSALAAEFAAETGSLANPIP